MSTYQSIVEDFFLKKCKLLTTKNEYDELIKISKAFNFKLTYIASCSHEHTVFYNVFKYRGTGVICPICKTKETTMNKKEKIKNNELSKLSTIEQEFSVIKKIQELLVNDFEIIKAFDGCNIDLIFRSKKCIEDKWVGIQVKTTKCRNLTYQFHLQSEYKNCIILLYSCDDNQSWIIPENTLNDHKRISIGFKKSKYNIYKITDDCPINKKLSDLYDKNSKHSFDSLNIPVCIYQQREKEFRKYREEKINFLKFEYDEMEGTVYDFKIGKYKIQEKVCQINEKRKRYSFCIYKNNGKIDKKRSFCNYEKGDNDFYWLQCSDKKFFFVIPEKVLIEKNMIGNKAKNKKFLCIQFTIKNELYKNQLWLKDYLFSYYEIEKDMMKLIKMFM